MFLATCSTLSQIPWFDSAVHRVSCFSAPAANKVGSRLDDGRAVEETGKWPWSCWIKLPLSWIAHPSGALRYRKMMELKEKGKKHPEVLTEASCWPTCWASGITACMKIWTSTEAQFLEKLPDAPAARQPVARCLWCQELRASSKKPHSLFGECNICCRLPVESQNAATASRMLTPNYFQLETTGVLHFSWMMLLRLCQFNAELGGSVGTPKLWRLDWQRQYRQARENCWHDSAEPPVVR